MLEIVLLLLLVFVAVRTKPPPASLRRFLQTQSSTPGGDSSLVGKLAAFLSLDGDAGAVETRDCGVCVAALATGGGGGARGFVGGFNTWVAVDARLAAFAVRGDFRRVEVDNRNDAAADESDALLSAAASRKAQRDYADAARLFSRAAAAAALPVDRGNALVEAAKCHSVLRQREYARDANIAAAKAFELMRDQNGWTRAAALYEKVGLDERDQGDLLRSLEYLDSSLSLYRNAGDGRAYHVDTQRADLLSLLGRFKDAIPLYESLSAYAITIPSLKFSVRPFLNNSLFCFLALQDQHGLKNALQAYSDEYPLFSDAEPIWRMLIHAWECGDVEVFDAVEIKFRGFHAVVNGSWQDLALSNVAKSLHSLC